MRLARPLRRTLVPAFRALAAHRLRAALALSGIAAGVAAVVLSGALGSGAEREVARGLAAMGTDLLVVRPAAVKRLVARKSVRGLASTLKLADAEAVAGLAPVAAAMPGTEGTLRVKGGGAALVTSVTGATEAFPRVRRFRLQAGRFFDAADDAGARRVAVLGARVAERLFGDADPGALVGQPIRLRGVPFKVVGVLAAKGVQPDGSDEDNQIVIPIRTALRRVFNATSLSSVGVSLRDPRRMAEAQAEIRALLRARHRRRGAEEDDDFEVQDRTKLLAAQNETVATLRLFTGGLSVLAFLVGGTGILALMLTAVKERTGEIGLRMAVGARPRDILVQFLAEAAALAFGGWLAGAAAGALGAAAVALGTRWPLALPTGALLASLAMAGVMGLGFGAFPARKASLLPPIAALATE
jgi:putative ABC transport system permease protein